jgi:hypothetical protein
MPPPTTASGSRRPRPPTATPGTWAPSACSTPNTLTLDGSQRRAIRRYRDHPALAQWILWNEPYNGVVPPGRPNPTRSGELRALWAGLLAERYGGDLGRLNRRSSAT